MYTIWKRDEEGAAKLIKTPGINLNTINASKATALHMAILRGMSSIVQPLIEAGADVNLGFPLIVALDREDYKSFDLLLQAGAKVNVRDHLDNTPLNVALKKQSLKAAERLLNLGADPNATDSEGNTELHRLLLELDLEDETEYPIREVIDLLGKKININAQNNAGQTALHLAIDLYSKTGSIDLLNAIIALIPLTNMALRDLEGDTPLTAAINYRDDEVNENVIPLFLSAEINANLKDSEGNSPLYWAARSRQKNVVELLIEYHVDLDAEDNSEKTVIEFLYDEIDELQNQEELEQADSEKIVKYQEIIQKLLDAGARDTRGVTPLMFAALDPDEKRGYEKTKEWISKKADVNAKDYGGSTAAMLAALKGKTEILKLLIQAGADLSICNDFGTTALFLAVRDKQIEAVNLIVPFLGPVTKALFDTDFSKINETEKFVKVLHHGLPPSDFSKALILSCLFRGTQMCHFILRELTPEERQVGIELVKKTYPGFDINWILESSTLKYNLLHFNVIQDPIPTPAKDVDLDSLLRMFDKINTKFPKKPGYLDPERLKDDGSPKTLKQIRKSLVLLVKRVKNKNEAFLATPKKGTPELIEFYTKLENALAFIIEKISDASGDPDVRTSVLFDLAIAGSHCGARYKSETADWYTSLSKGVETLTLPQEIEKILQKTRIGVVEKMTKQMIYDEGHRIGIVNRPHIYNQIVRTIGNRVGIPGVTETYQDTAFWMKNLTDFVLLGKFFALYSPKEVIDRIDAAINGGTDRHGNRILASREIHPLMVDSCFKGRMPADWKLNESLLFTRIEVAGEEKEFDYQTYNQMVNKEFEGEKKRLAGLSEEEIVKEASPRIKEHLLSQYRIKLGDNVDPQNWEQVRVSIEAQMKELKGGYRGLLEKPGKLEEIKEYIEQHFKGRQNYMHYAVEGLLSKFGIIAPFQWQEWEAVKQVIENMRIQEYVNTVIRDEKGVVHREQIRDLLVELGVFVKA